MIVFSLYLRKRVKAPNRIYLNGVGPLHIWDHTKKTLDIRHSICSHPMETGVKRDWVTGTSDPGDGSEGNRVQCELPARQVEGMSSVGPSLHQRVQRLVVSPTLSIWKGQDKILEPCVLNPVLNIICELIIPHPSPMKVPSTLECVGIKLQLKQGVNS